MNDLQIALRRIGGRFSLEQSRYGAFSCLCDRKKEEKRQLILVLLGVELFCLLCVGKKAAFDKNCGDRQMFKEIDAAGCFLDLAVVFGL